MFRRWRPPAPNQSTATTTNKKCIKSEKTMSSSFSHAESCQEGFLNIFSGNYHLRTRYVSPCRTLSLKETEQDTLFLDLPNVADTFSPTPNWARPYYLYHLYWWEFNLHSKLKLVQRVQLFECYKEIIEEDLYLTVCEWLKDDSKIVIYGSFSEDFDDLFINVASNPPSTPCPHCCPVPSATSTIRTDSGRGGCLEHGYILTYGLEFQAALHMEKDQVILWDDRRSLIACGISFCPAGEHSQSPKIYSVRAAPPAESESSGSESSQSSSSPPPFTSTVPQGSPDGRQTFTRSPSSSSPPTSPLSSHQEASLRVSEPTYVNYTHLHYCLPQPGAVEPFEDLVDHTEMRFNVRDLSGRKLWLVRGSHNRPCVCLEQLTLSYEALINEVIRSGTWGRQIRQDDFVYDPVILEVCPETNQVMIDIGLLLMDSEKPPNTYQSNLQVSWDLNTGLCCTIGAGDLTEFKDDWKSSHRKSCAKCLVVPENSYIHCMSNKALEAGMLADSDRCTSIVF